MRLNSRQLLTVIVLAQLAGTSLWFAGNAVIDGMQVDLGLPANALGPITSSVQLGFICGTLTFAILTVADRFSPSRVFFACAVLGGLINSGIALLTPDYVLILVMRFATGFALAGIYPVGMKIAADHFPGGLGKALGYLLGALALGTAFPHLVRSLLSGLPWQTVLLSISAICITGGLFVLLLVPDGPYRKPATALDLSAAARVFRKREFRSAAFGYFGHMWELYAFWAFVPVILLGFYSTHSVDRPLSLMAFCVMGIGGLSCVLGGYAARRRGSARIAFAALAVSGVCCLLSPLIFELNEYAFTVYMFVWGFAVIADSPQLSTLVATSAPSENTATALTIVNCVGFSVSVISIQLLNWLSGFIDISYVLIFLLPGPLLGLWGMRIILQTDPTRETQLSNQ